MKAKIKYCGLKTPEAVRLAAKLSAWKVGLIFFEKSPRNVSLQQAGELAELARSLKLETVAVTVDADSETLDKIVEQVRPDMLQFHGSESPDHITAMKQRFSLPAMKAISLREVDDLAAIALYRDVADFLLFDAKPPKGAELPGGNGVSFDWQLLDGLAEKMNYVLSGGLSAETVGAALLATGATYLDISSGIESAPGIKDPARMISFAEAVLRQEAAQTELSKETVS